MKKYNIVWTIVDSVRHYHSDDDRSRLDIMDEFAKEGLEFRNIVTSAPSTVMSISAMMTGLPSYYLGRNYSDFRFDNDYFSTLSSIVNKNGWTTRALIMHKDIREKLRVFDMLPRKYWPKGYSHKDWWDNSKINQLLHNTIKKDGSKLPHPCFWFLDFNCRKDPNTSDIVKDSMKALQDAGYTKDNTIFILCSDHGYPDPSRGVTPEELKRKNMTHDIFMTDDNILIPMIISYPGCTPGQKIDTTVSTLDLLPTLIDILELDVPDEVRSRWCGKSLLPLIKGNNKKDFENPKIRTDARFLGQSGRVCALRGDKYKYVYHHDEKKEEFFDISKFKIEEQDISDSPIPEVQNALIEFRQDFLESERLGIEFQINYTSYKLGKQINKLRKSKLEEDFKVLVLSTASGVFLYSLGSALRKILGTGDLTLVTPPDTFKDNLQATHYNNVINFSDFQVSEKDWRKMNEVIYDLIILTYDSSQKSNFDNLSVFSKKIRSKKLVMMDLNMSISIRKGQVQRYFRTLNENRVFFTQEPSLIFFEIWKIFKVALARIRLKFIKTNKSDAKQWR
jgi:hypothetical protein